jgi:hypothetical protein
MHRLLRFARLSSLSAGLMLTTSLMASGPVRAAGAFHRTLSLQGVTFHVQATGAGSQQQLTITTSAGKRALKPIHQTVDGQVMDAEVADLNGNGQPELFVYVQSAGSGSYGEVVAYAVIKGDALLPDRSAGVERCACEGLYGPRRLPCGGGLSGAAFPDLQTR